ncbi:MAG: hypothetical protein IPF60_07420 [Betaproteobacteria bacterium]|nr:hypothetical protein [Betaproteobacteria bacterium]
MDDGKYRYIIAIAAAEGLDVGQASRIARLTQLVPDIIDASVAPGENELSMEQLMRRGFPADWGKQRHALLTPRE